MQKEKIVGLTKGKGSLTYRGTPVHIDPDLLAGVSKLRATFNGVKAQVQETRMDYSLYYPAVLVLNLNDIRHIFDPPQEAEEFYQVKISPWLDG